MVDSILKVTENEWNKVKEIILVLGVSTLNRSIIKLCLKGLINLYFIHYIQIFIRTTKIVSSAKYPILATTIPIYNFLIKELENYCDNSDYNDIVLAVNAGLKKLDTYYTKTDDTTMYTIATGKLNIKIIIIFLNW